jgi:U3 small nucleolar RNA-associated protein 12
VQDTCLEQLPQERSTSVAEALCIRNSPDSSMLAAGYADGCIRLWNTAECKCIAVFHSHSRAVTALAFNANGGCLASGSQDTDIILWDVAGEVGMYKLHGHTNQVTALVVLDEQNKLVSAGKDGFIRVWDLAAQFCMQTIPVHSGECQRSKQAVAAELRPAAAS